VTLTDHVAAVQVTKRYGSEGARHDALRGVSLQVDAGEFVALRGPSGCGKSTLLHLLGAMDRPSSGEVWLGGRRIDTLNLDELAKVRRRQVGFVFQAFNLLPTMSSLENVALPLLLDGKPDAESRHRSVAALESVGLGSRRSFFPSQLSGGEMQRVAIARALALRPQILLADEPTGSLDSVNGRHVLELLAELNASEGITILMATHAEEASAYASRVIHLRDGQIDPAASCHVVSPTV
jgi:putative ABC transport system ATP-binding protein